jgi:coenzyme F420-reducing hydrogenase gamma subunit
MSLSCSEKKERKSDFEDQVLDLVIENSNGKPVEFPELYDKLVVTIPVDDKEKLKFVEKLKAKDFKVINWGRGNHILGPRIIIITLKKEDCECEVAKIYYSTVSETVYNITERVSCKKTSL